MSGQDKQLLLIRCLVIFELVSWVEGIATWPFWGNQFHPPPPPHIGSSPNYQWPPPSQNIIPSLITYPQQEFVYHRLPYPFNDYHSRHEYFPVDSLPDATPSSLLSNQIPSSNYSASFKVSHPTVRHVDSQNGPRDLNLMLYQAHPSYDRIMHPPPSILITSRPFSVTTPTKTDRYVPGEVKLSSSPAVQFAPHPNIPATGSATGWNTAVTLQVSLRPESWTKSKRPTVTDKMRQFLPELKYYKNGLKAMNPNLVKNTVEKYVLVAKKQEQTDREVVTQPSVTVVANDLIVYPGPSSEEPARDKLPEDDWEEDSDESRFNSHEESTIPVFDASTNHPILMKFSTKTPSKSIDQIVAEVFATATPNARDNESHERETTQEEKGLSDLFDMIYVQSNSTQKNIANHTTQSWLKMEPKKRTEANTKIVDIITAPPDVLPLPISGITLGYTSLQEDDESAVNENITQTSSLNNTSSIQTTTADKWVEEDVARTTEAVTIRCQGMWCHHSTSDTSQSEPLKSQQQATSNEIRTISTGTNNFVDPLLNYLGLAWPQHESDRQSKSSSLNKSLPLPSSSTTTTAPTTTSSLNFTVHPVKNLTTTTNTPPPPMRDHDVVNLIPLESAKRPNYKELRDFGYDSYASPPPATQVSREHLGAMFNALGHGIGQVMSIVMPLAAPKRKDASELNSHSENHHGSIDSMDFDAFS